MRIDGGGGVMVEQVLVLLGKKNRGFSFQCGGGAVGFYGKDA
jgi:hypothetical protein